MQCILAGISKSNNNSGSQVIESNLFSTNWTEDNSGCYQDVAFSGYELGDNGIIMLNPSITFDQIKAAAKGILGIGSSSNGIIRIICNGKKPNINIPIVLMIINSQEE